MARRVLMITSSWPPVGRIGGRRPLRLARRLPDLGWTPVILTPVPESVYFRTSLDPNLVAPPVEVHRVPGRLPSMVVAKAIHRFAQKHGPSLATRAAGALLRDTRFIDQFTEWTPTILATARRVAPIDAIWVTGQPFGLFVGAAAAAKMLDVPLMLDYRDPWTPGLPPRKHPFQLSRRTYARVERALLRRAQAAAFVNQEILDGAAGVCPKPEHAAWGVVPNGFDVLDVPPVAAHDFGRPTLVYAGSCYASRSMKPVLEALAEGFGPGDQGLQLVMHGELDPAAQAFLDANPLPGRVTIAGRISSTEITARLKGAAAQLLVIGDTHADALSGKVFDYLMTQRPILGVGPAHASARQLIADTGTGVWASDRPSLIAQLRRIEAEGLPYAPVAEALKPWSADAMAERTAALLDHAAR